MRTLRTPDERFANLPGWPYEPRYVEIPDGDGGTLRVHYVDEGPADAPPILLLHGEPSWAYLYRKMIPVLIAAGYRVRRAGPGRLRPQRQAHGARRLHLPAPRRLDDRRGSTAVDLQGVDARRARTGAGSSGCASSPSTRSASRASSSPTPSCRPATRPRARRSSTWQGVLAETPDFHVGGIVKGGCARRCPTEVIAAYNAPFPDDSYKAGARQFPVLVPISPDDPGRGPNSEAWEVLEKWEKPVPDRVQRPGPDHRAAATASSSRVSPGTKGQPHTTIDGGGHFLQEDKGEELAQVIVDWFARP